jgi:NAD(P)-dependent dehydrogenase (short-subunit alcohol dehydrogenase family)
MPSEDNNSTNANVAIVIGANRGLGRSTALALAERGVDLIITFRSNRAEAKDLVKMIATLGQKAVAFHLDIGAVDTFLRFAKKVQQALRDHWGAERFCYLVNNTGHVAVGPTAGLTEADFEGLSDVHLKGVFLLTQHLRPLIADGGRIINVSSGLTRFTAPGMAASGPMKGALETLTYHMAKEFGPRDVTAGTTATDFGSGIIGDNPEMQKDSASITALGRTGQTDDIGKMIATLLVSDADRWVNAPRIEVPDSVKP